MLKLSTKTGEDHKEQSVNNILTGGLETIAIRIPQSPVLLELLKGLNTGLAAPSANPHKHISPTAAEHVKYTLYGKIAAILDGGPCKFGIESTIIDLTSQTPKILRPGPITEKMLEEVLQMSIQPHYISKERVSGNMRIHYQPYTETLLMTLREIENYLSCFKNRHKTFAIMHYSPFKTNFECIHLKRMPSNKSHYARQMYKTLHHLDTTHADQILIEVPPNDMEWSDVFDRLSKASSSPKQNK